MSSSTPTLPNTTGGSDSPQQQQQQQPPPTPVTDDAETTATNTSNAVQLLSWQKRSITGGTDSRADSKINDSGGGGRRVSSSMNGAGAVTLSITASAAAAAAAAPTQVLPLDPEDAATLDDNGEVPRLVLRDLPYAQSHNNIQVRHNYSFLKINKLIHHDWFHVLLRFPTSKSLFILISIWTLFLVIWAGCYVWVDRSNTGVECGLGPNGNSITFRGAFAFSLQTCTTVGYTLPSGSNAFFNYCPGLQMLIYTQMVFSMMFNAFLFAFFYTRVAKADSRGNQILFSTKAIVSIVDGQVRFQVRMYDVDAINPVLEASIRMYVVLKSQPVPKRIRILQPNDELGSMLFLSLPAVASHHIDIYSLLHPPRVTPVNPSGLTLRQADSAISSRLEVLCPVCAQNFGTYERWVSHMKYMVIMEGVGDVKRKSTRLHSNTPKSEYMSAPPDYTTASLDIAVFKKHFENEISEVICVVEGIEPISSGQFSSLQSYRLEDIVFHEGARFRPCVENVTKHKKEAIRIDLDRFHEIDTVDTSRADKLTLKRTWQRSVRGYDGIFFQSTKPKGAKRVS